MRPIEPIRPTLSPRFLQDRIELTGADNVVQKYDYAVEAVRKVHGLAPYLECWEQHRRKDYLPSLQDFDVVREAIGISGVHLVETPSSQFEDFRFVSFDSTTRLDGHDFSGTHVASYPDHAFRQAARLDYSSAFDSGEACFSRLEFTKKNRRGKFARLVLPISDSNSATPSKLLVIVQILEHRPSETRVVNSRKSKGRLGARRRPAGSDAAMSEYLDPNSGGRARTDWEHVRGNGGDELVARYFHSGIHEKLADEDLLEWMLRQSVGGGRSEDIAARLIERFGSLPSVVAMGWESLADYPEMDFKALLNLKVARELATRLVRTEVINKPKVSDGRQVIDYCRARMAHETVEHLRILYLDQKNRLISDEVFLGGGVSSVSVNPRQIVKRAILLDAQSIIMAHNHPSGDPSPSGADVEVTRDVKRAAEAVGIRLLDHLIIGRSGSVSLRTLGYLEEE